MNEVVKKPVSGSAINAQSADNPFTQYGRSAAGRSFVGDLLLFDKYGEYHAGQEKIEVPLGTKLHAYMDSFSVGWQRWEDSVPVELIMGPVARGYIPPKRDTLGHLDKTQWEQFPDGREKDPWVFTNTLVLVDLAESEPRFYTFSTSSKGGINALGALALRYGEHLRLKPDESPIIDLGRDSYQHSNKSYGEIRVPVLKIVGYVPTKNLPAIEGIDTDVPPQLPSGGGGAAATPLN